MPDPRYGRVAVLFHWTIAALIVANLALGWRMGYLAGLAQFDMFQLHKSIGITILALSVLRLGWRLAHPAPPPAPSVTRGEHALSQAVHWGFYAIMIGMPLTGWIVVSTSTYDIPTLLYRVIPWPHVPGLHGLTPPARATVNTLSDTTHMALAFGTVALLVLHVAGVAKHHLLDRDPVLRRMSPIGRRSPTEES